jgi:Flp pilus assembly protein TadD
VLLLLIVWVGMRPPVTSAGEGAGARKLAILPFLLPSTNPEWEWFGEGLAHVLALRLQHLPRLRVTALSRLNASGGGSVPQPLEGADVAQLLEQIRHQGDDVVLFGSFLQLDTTLRLELQLWSARPDRLLAKTLEQSPEKDPDGLGIKGAAFVVGALQAAATDIERRRVEERLTTSAEAFERFARALALSDGSTSPEDVAQAVTLLTEAVSLDGKFAAAQRQLGDLHLRREQYGSAVDAYQSLLNLVKREPRVYRLLGTASFAQGEAGRAIEAFRRGLQLDPRDPQLHLSLGLAYAAGKEYDKATNALLRALEFAPEDPLAFANLGVIYLLQGNFAAATSSLRRAQLLAQSDPLLAYNLGLALLWERVYDQARDQFEQALQRKPDFPAAAYQLALVYERIDPRQAVERWKKYLELAQRIPGEDAWISRAREHLARLQEP